MAIHEKQYTAQEFWELSQETSSESRLELIERVIFEMRTSQKSAFLNYPTA
jgi:hypothetical protein